MKFAAGILTTAVLMQMSGNTAAVQSQCSTVTLNAWMHKCAGDHEIADAHLPTSGACVNTEVLGYPGSASALVNPDGTFDIAIFDDPDCDGTAKVDHNMAYVRAKTVKEDACDVGELLGITVQCGTVSSPSKAVAASPAPSSSPASSAPLSQSAAPSATSIPSSSAAPTPSPPATIVSVTTTTVPSSAVTAASVVVTPKPVIATSAVDQSVAAVAVTAAPVVPSQTAHSASQVIAQVIATQPTVSYVTTCAARFPRVTTSTEPCCRWGHGKCAGLTKCDLDKCGKVGGHKAQSEHISKNELVCGDKYNGDDIELNKPCCKHGDGVCPGLLKCMRKNCRKANHTTTNSVAKVFTSTGSNHHEITCAEKKILDAGSLKCEVHESRPCCRHSGECGNLAKCQTKNCCRD